MNMQKYVIKISPQNRIFLRDSILLRPKYDAGIKAAR